ncbi:MAG TPA: DNA mismatch repair endonuclease MutL, partial [Candidatus Cloacimonadota bacterium]|nr:DNA mismatch repair endonuclease MutL [Candidatus Cloacimonadota bacterium]
LATQVDFHDGKLMNVSKTAANIGTTIIVKKLFIQVPARRKFLKTDQVELKHILNYLHYQAILFPQIAFKLMVDQKERLSYPAVESRDDRMLAVFGTPFMQSDWIKIHHQVPALQLEGYIGGLEEEKTSFADYHYLFINGRFITDKIIQHSIRTAYEPFIRKTRIFSQGNTPPYILFLSMNPELIDINVHPAKSEVRFRDTQLVYGFVKNTLSNSLMEYEEKRFRSTLLEVAKSNEDNGEFSTSTGMISNSNSSSHFQPPKKEPFFSSYRQPFEQLYQPDLFTRRPVQSHDGGEPHVVAPEQQDISIFLPSEEDLVNPWQLHQSYIFIQVEDGLMIIDQHAAHERILYEKIIHRLHGVAAETQKLLFPIVVDIPPYISSIVLEQIEQNLEALYKVGFSIKSFSGNSIVIEEIPVEIEDWEGGDLFIEILKQFESEYESNEDFRDSMAKSVACKAAIKAGKKLTRKEMLVLINDLFACQVPYFCPHGRPLMIRMPLQELEKRFKRLI